MLKIYSLVHNTATTKILVHWHLLQAAGTLLSVCVCLCSVFPPTVARVKLPYMQVMQLHRCPPLFKKSYYYCIKI